MSSYMVPGAPALNLGGPDRDAKIDALEAAMRAEPGSAPEIHGIEIVHHFAPGIYAREMRVPAGRIVTSKVHKYENFSILSRGRMVLYHDDGRLTEIEAGLHIVAPAGARRVAFVVEDCVWTSIHATDERDIAKIEAHFVAATRGEYLEYVKETKWLGTT